MTVADQIKFLDKNLSKTKKYDYEQYDLDRKAPKISALSSNKLDKYEYLNSEDLDYKASTVERVRFSIVH